MSELRVAALQMAMVVDLEANVATAERLVRDAASQGAQIILIPELFEGPYFCKDQLPEHLDRARSLDGHPTIAHFAAVAAELGVVLPLSVYERAGQALFNTVVVVDADGSTLGRYRKSHVPDGPGYTEKYYFSPGDTGFRVWNTMHGAIGVGICWDQWFPESARSMALLGAEVLLYPTAIGSEPPDPTWDSSGHWQRVMQGHAHLDTAIFKGHHVLDLLQSPDFKVTFRPDFDQQLELAQLHRRQAVTGVLTEDHDFAMTNACGGRHDAVGRIVRFQRQTWETVVEDRDLKVALR